MEVGQAVLALDLIDTELDLAERVVLILLEIGERNLEDASLQGVVGVLETGGTVDKGLSDTVAKVRQPSVRNIDPRIFDCAGPALMRTTPNASSPISSA